MAISSKQRAEVVRLLDTGGMTAREIAEAVGVSVSTVERVKTSGKTSGETVKSPSEIPQNHVRKPSENRQSASEIPQKTFKNEGRMTENEGDLKEKRRDSEGLREENEGFEGAILKEVRERLADKEKEVEYLRDALTKSQEVAAAALSRAEESDRRAAIMIAATATGQIGQFSPQGATETASSTADDTKSTQNGGENTENKRRWWQLWK
jgi:transposase